MTLKTPFTPFNITLLKVVTLSVLITAVFALSSVIVETEVSSTVFRSFAIAFLISGGLIGQFVVLDLVGQTLNQIFSVVVE